MVVKNRERTLNATHNDFRVSGAHLKKMTERNAEALKEIFFVKSVTDVSPHLSTMSRHITWCALWDETGHWESQLDIKYLSQ